MLIKTLKILFFMILPTLVLVFFLESATRLLVYIATGKSDVLLYGFNDASFEVDALRKLHFNINIDKKDFKISEESGIKPKDLSNKIRVWTFGGSSTYGYNCSANASSWPNELQRIYPTLNITNFGRNGTDSSYALEKLSSELYYSVPDIVIWANRPNETRFLSTGKTPNLEVLDKLGDKNFTSTNVLMLNKSFIKTLKAYSTVLVITDYILARLMAKMDPNKGELIEPFFNETNLKLAALNYRLNIEKVIKLSELRDFDVIILTLFNVNDMKRTYYRHETWNDQLFSVKKEMAKKENVVWLNSILHMPDSNDYYRFFCDPTHQTLEGNIATGKIVADKLLQLGY